MMRGQLATTTVDLTQQINIQLLLQSIGVVVTGFNFHDTLVIKLNQCLSSIRVVNFFMVLTREEKKKKKKIVNAQAGRRFFFFFSEKIIC